MVVDDCMEEEAVEGSCDACEGSSGLGAFTGRRATALGVGTGIAAVSYLRSSLASVVSWIRAAKRRCDT